MLRWASVVFREEKLISRPYVILTPGARCLSDSVGFLVTHVLFSSGRLSYVRYLIKLILDDMVERHQALLQREPEARQKQLHFYYDAACSVVKTLMSVCDKNDIGPEVLRKDL